MTDPRSYATPPLARYAVDRAAHRRTDAEWLARAWDTAEVLVVDVAAGGQALVREPGNGAGTAALVLLPSAQCPPVAAERRLFLGEAADGSALFAVDAPLPALPGTRAANLRDVGHLLADRDAGLLTTAVALAGWHAGHGFSSVTGAPTDPVQGGWARVDPAGAQVWPRTDPAIIVLVHDGVAGPAGRCLLGRNAGWGGRPGARRFSCLAGFVEPGESAEAAVAREVREEVGVALADIAYVGSQAWPFPGSLMLGFEAYADPLSPVRVDEEEIVEARWFTRREIGAVYADERVDLGDGDALLLPMNVSIASYLIARWWRGD
ncbi:MAG TPA: NAD(+) diphosphatase [Pilimelia sp.]|nr:NAD(+) diphosphatase [Pilimelia sp.]